MYTEYWGLAEKPFENNLDTRFLYSSPQHEEALARLLYAIREHKGSAMLSGVFGCGKTLIAKALQENLSHEQYRVASLNVPPRRYSDLFRGVVRSLRSAHLPTNESEISLDALIQMLEESLEENVREGRETIIMVDEAHAIPNSEVFDGLRVLLNFHSQSSFKLTLILIGQPELTEIIDGNKPFEQRIGIKARLIPFRIEETQHYIRHRLSIVGCSRALFEPAAIELIQQNTGGIPRRINRICDVALLSASLQMLETINKECVHNEIGALQGEV